MARIEAEREAGIHFRAGYEYGPGPDDLPETLYGPDGAPFYNYLGPEDTVPEPPFSNTASHLGDNTPILEPPLQPSELQPHYIPSHSGMCGNTGEEMGTAVPSPRPPPARRGQGSGQTLVTVDQAITPNGLGQTLPYVAITPNLQESVTSVAGSFSGAVVVL